MTEPRKMEIGPLVKIISHDLRGPLGNLKNIVALFKSGELDMDQAKMFLEHVELGVDRSLKLLDDLIEWSHASSADKKVTQEAFSVSSVIEEVCGQLAERLSDKELTFSFAPASVPNGFFDKSALKVIVKNLVQNAINFTSNQGSVQVQLEEGEEDLVVSITDSGIGIPDKMIDTIFEMGKDNRRLGTNEEKGTGIGLFICKDLADRNESKIWVANTSEGKGSTFCFSIKKVEE